MRSPPAVCERDPATATYFLPKSVGEAFIVTIVVKQFSPAITASDDVVIGTSELEAEASRLPLGERSESKNRFTLTRLPPRQHRTQGQTPAKPHLQSLQVFLGHCPRSFWGHCPKDCRKGIAQNGCRRCEVIWGGGGSRCALAWRFGIWFCLRLDGVTDRGRCLVSSGDGVRPVAARVLIGAWFPGLSPLAPLAPLGDCVWGLAARGAIPGCGILLSVRHSRLVPRSRLLYPKRWWKKCSVTFCEQLPRRMFWTSGTDHFVPLDDAGRPPRQVGPLASREHR